MDAKRRDSELEQWVLRSFCSQKHLRSREICVHAYDGVLTLYGSVSDYTSRIVAESAAYRVPGVTEIVNRIQVKSCIALVLQRAMRVTLASSVEPGKRRRAAPSLRLLKPEKVAREPLEPALLTLTRRLRVNLMTFEKL